MIVVVVLIVLSLGRFLLHSVRALFFVLLGALVLVFVFGLSYTDLLDWVVKILLWVF
tara:strand:+ start:1255 stop:1425 length:171 start_codon:yes stop_codon:yes gene_type:complete